MAKRRKKRINPTYPIDYGGKILTAAEHIEETQDTLEEDVAMITNVIKNDKAKIINIIKFALVEYFNKDHDLRIDYSMIYVDTMGDRVNPILYAGIAFEEEDLEDFQITSEMIAEAFGYDRSFADYITTSDSGYEFGVPLGARGREDAETYGGPNVNILLETLDRL